VRRRRRRKWESPSLSFDSRPEFGLVFGWKLAVVVQLKHPHWTLPVVLVVDKGDHH
jgi:hypothetical protein